MRGKTHPINVLRNEFKCLLNTTRVTMTSCTYWQVSGRRMQIVASEPGTFAGMRGSAAVWRVLSPRLQLLCP